MKLPDYEKWSGAHTDAFTMYDYIYQKRASLALPLDFIYAMTELFAPQFIQKGDGYFLAQQFSEEKFAKLNHAEEIHHAEYWLNMLSVDGLLEAEENACIEIAERMASGMAR